MNSYLYLNLALASTSDKAPRGHQQAGIAHGKMFKRKRQADTDSRKAGNPLSSVELLERSSGHSPCNLPSNTPRGQRPRNINFRKTKY